VLNRATTRRQRTWEATYIDLERLGMNRLRNSGLLRYAAGLCGVFFGAWLSAITSSMVPLALAASAALLCTASLVKAIWNNTYT